MDESVKVNLAGFSWLLAVFGARRRYRWYDLEAAAF